ncbi:MAG: DUF6794 domain-containing protein [Candidatus Marinimicrobia bacterium]|nr:DUF6794 domain-containing protein [Candidatus Neomarinimicrobiota bacterium]
MTEREKERIRQLSEMEFTAQYHMTAGMDIHNRWLYPEDSPLRKFFEKEGLSFKDDMSTILLTSLYRCLKRQEIRYEEQLEGAVRYGLLKKNQIPNHN